MVAYTSLAVADRISLERSLEQLLGELGTAMGIRGWVSKGDFLELHIPRPQDGLRAMLAVKTFIRSLDLGSGAEATERAKLHREHGIRLALGLGELDRIDLDKLLLDGPAINQAGRLLSEESTHDKKRVTVKRTLFLCCSDPAIERQTRPLLALIDALLSRNTAKQCGVVYLRLLGKDEKQIGKMLGRSQSTINRHTTQASWHALEEAIIHFETLLDDAAKS